MNSPARLRPLWLAAPAIGLSICLWASGCSDTTGTPTAIEPTPPQVIDPKPDASGTPKPEASQTPASDQPAATKPEGETPAPASASPSATKPASESTAPASETPAAPKPEAATTSSAAPAAEAQVALVPVKYEEMLSRIAANKNAKLTMVDAWATWCGPCKENFPHVVAMNAKYAGKGLAVISLSLDDPTNTKAVDEAKKFLAEKNATFTNFLLNETQDDGFEKLNTNAIPAVFLYGPDGKEIKRFTMDDPNKQFTYDEVEKTVAEMLGAAK